MSLPARCPACGALPTERPDPDGHTQCAFCGVHYQVGGGLTRPERRRRWPLALGVLIVATAAAVVFALLPRPDARPGQGPANPRAIAASAAGAEAAGALSATFAFHTRRPSVDTSFLLYGEVTNTSTEPLRAVEVVAVLRDASGGEVGTWSGYSLDERVEPGARSPVRILVKDPATFDHIDYEVYARPATPTIRVTEGLRVEPAAPTQDTVFRRLSGQVVNEGPSPVKLAKVTAIARDANDRIVGVAEGFAKEQQLAPGASARWDMLASFGGVVDHFEYRVSALPVAAP